MQFNSYVYIFAFLPLTVIAYYLLNRINLEAGKLLLVAVGILFYGWTNWSILTVMLISLSLNYLFVILLLHNHQFKRFFLIIPIIINVGLLLYFKYFNFLVWNINAVLGKTFENQNIILPLGISFFTFQQIACLVSVSRGDLCSLSLIDYLSFILFFPKLLMGPLMEPTDFVIQINDKKLKTVNWDHIACGIKIFCYGLFKKTVLADTFSKAVEWGYSNISSSSALDWILIMLFYTFEIYYDFSGYSDMATGASLMLNITLPINFNSPYKAVSIRDFWKRWHISLTKFLTKYIYIPLGGSRKGKLFTYLNTMIVFLISGLWHGADWTFVLWGALHGLFSVFDRIFEKTRSRIICPIRWFLTFGAVNVLWLLFRSYTIRQWLSLIRKILLFEENTVSQGLLNTFFLPELRFLSEMFSKIGGLSSAPWLWMILFLAFAFFICLVPQNNYTKLHKNNSATLLPALLAFLWSTLCLSNETAFVYFNF